MATRPRGRATTPTMPQQPKASSDDFSFPPVPPPTRPVGPGPGPVVVQSVFAEHPLRTGRKLVRIAPGGEPGDAEKLLRSSAGLRVHPVDAGAVAAAALPARATSLSPGEGVLFRRFGIMTVNPDPDQAVRLAALVNEDNPIEGEEWERYVFVAADASFLRGYRAGVDGLVERLLSGEDATPGPAGTGLGRLGGGGLFRDDDRTTWGLKATRADATRFTGRGIAVAVLDTGMDLTHQDFLGRIAGHQSFVDGQQVQDGHGHGTHCCGVVAGPFSPVQGPRYGVASEARLFVGKVLGNDGIGTDTSILGGIEWALDQGCVVVSMSLGAPVRAGQRRSRAFEQVGRRCLDAGTVIVAAAGNDSHRPGDLQRVSHPANCRTFAAVAALDHQLRVASFSNAGIEQDGGQVDIAGPGVRVHSSIPGGYGLMDGTSMATPHVAGLATLLAEKDPGLRGHALLGALAQRAARLPAASSADVGAGLAQAP